MPWARFADDYLGNQKLATLSTSAIALDMAGIIYSARELRDGHLSVADVQAIAALVHIKTWKPSVVELVSVCRWVPLLAGDGWEIHDYLDYQPSREQVLKDRGAAADRKRKQRAANGQYESVSRRDSGVSSPGVTSTPYPVPVPVPEFPNGNPRSSPQTPQRGAHRRRPKNGLEFDEDGPRYEQREDANGNRRWVRVEGETEMEMSDLGPEVLAEHERILAMERSRSSQ